MTRFAGHPAIRTLRSPKQEYCEFQGNLSYRQRKKLSQKTKNKTYRKVVR